MTMLPNNKLQCDRCLAVHVPARNARTDLAEDLFALGWVARPGFAGRYKHACRICAEDFIAEFEGRKIP